jgi:hypothetical protein
MSKGIVAIAGLLFAIVSLTSFASAYNMVQQDISMTANGGQITQSAANAAVIVGSNNYVDQSVRQNANGDYITQSGANAAAIAGNNNYVDQSVVQNADGSYITQSGANAVAIVGDNNYANQNIQQTAFGENIFQSGQNTGTMMGDCNSLAQSIMAYASMYPQPVDPSQVMSNQAFIAGSHNRVKQKISGRITMGSGNAPISQRGSNYIQSPDDRFNHYDQGMNLDASARPGTDITQYGQNQVRIG